MSIPWLTGTMLRRSQDHQDPDLDEALPEEENSSTIHGEEAQRESAGSVNASEVGRGSRLNNRSRLRIDMPPPNTAFTLAQNATPGWETPWTSAHPNGTGHRFGSSGGEGSQHDEEKLTTWQKSRKRLRAYMMYNIYVPLVRRHASSWFSLICLIWPCSCFVSATSCSPLLLLQSPYGYEYWRNAAELLVLLGHPRMCIHARGWIILTSFGRLEQWSSYSPV